MNKAVYLVTRNGWWSVGALWGAILALGYCLGHGEARWGPGMDTQPAAPEKTLLRPVPPWAEGKTHLHTLPVKCRDFTTDKLQNVYLIDDNNRVYKFGPGGTEQFHYNNNTRGRLSYIDPTDPFNLLLFYPELQAVAMLDRTMNETALLELFTAGVINATAIGLAIDNNIWVYDQAAFRLLKVGPGGKVLLRSDNLSALLQSPPQATQLLANNNLIYLNCPGQGVYVFDNFGQFHQRLPFPNVESLQILDGKLLLYEQGQVRVYNPETLREKWLRPDTTGVRHLRYQGNRLYEHNAEGLVDVYKKS